VIGLPPVFVGGVKKTVTAVYPALTEVIVGGSGTVVAGGGVGAFDVGCLGVALYDLKRRTAILDAPTPEPGTYLFMMVPFWFVMVAMGNTRPAAPLPLLMGGLNISIYVDENIFLHHCTFKTPI
jgi:hypothetical protein